jgi:hypothetical protein
MRAKRLEERQQKLLNSPKYLERKQKMQQMTINCEKDIEAKGDRAESRGGKKKQTFNNFNNLINKYFNLINKIKKF